MPVLTLPRALLTLLSLAILGAAAYLLWSWAQGAEFRLPDGTVRHVSGPAWQLWTGLAALAWSFLGRFVVLALIPARDDPKLERGPPRMLTAPDGSKIALEISGRSDGPVIVMTHGWGMDRRIWAWTRRALERRYRLAMWDLPGLGQSGRPADGKITIERFAEALGTVVEAVAERPVVLVGHSIGGMVTQTLFRAQPDLARRKVAGVVLVDTTYTNPLRTMWLAPLWRALQKPVLEPLSWLMVALSPLVWLMNWQSWLSGGSQLAMRLAGFGRYASRRQVDSAAFLACQNSPAIQAKGNLAMFHWDAGEALRGIEAPTLVISGDRDIVTLRGAGEVIASRIRGARMSVVEGGGHMGFMEAASAINAEIERFAEQAFMTPRGPRAAGSDGAARRRPQGEAQRPGLH